MLITGCGWLRPRRWLRPGVRLLHRCGRLRARRWLGRVWAGRGLGRVRAGRGLMGVVLLRGPDTVLVCFGFGLCRLLLGTSLGFVFGLLLCLGLLLGAFLISLAPGLVAVRLAFFGMVCPPYLDAAEQLVEATTLLVVVFLDTAGEGRVVGVVHGCATGCGAACGRVGVEDRGAGGLTDLVVGQVGGGNLVVVQIGGGYLVLTAQVAGGLFVLVPARDVGRIDAHGAGFVADGGRRGVDAHAAGLVVHGGGGCWLFRGEWLWSPGGIDAHGAGFVADGGRRGVDASGARLVLVDLR